MKKIRHWLHILLVLITGGVWLPVYLIIVSTTEMYNRGYRAAEADISRKWGRKAGGYTPVFDEHHEDCKCPGCLHAPRS